MTILAIAFVLDNPENDSKMQRHRGQQKAPRHLWIIDAQRAARGTMNRLFQNRRMVVVHRMDSLVKMVLAYLDPMRNTRRAEKQKALEQLVVVGSGIDVSVPEKCFENSAVLDVLKNGHVDPRLMLVRIHT